MINASNYLNYRTGDEIGNISDLEAECYEHVSLILEDLNSKFNFSNVLLGNLHVKIDTVEKAERFYGSGDIRIVIKNAIHVCYDELLKRLLIELLDISNNLMGKDYDVDKSAIDYLLSQSKEIVSKIRWYYENLCKGCNDRACRFAIQQVLDSHLSKQIVLGTFSPSNCVITLFTKSISDVTGNKDLFNCQFMATLTHEVFHYYHHIVTGDNISIGDSIMRKQPEILSPYNQYHEKYEYNNEDDCENIRPGDRSIVHHLTKITEDRVVKESLASYYEFDYCKFANITNATFEHIGNALNAQWHQHSIYEWPYSGARTFIPDEDRIESIQSSYYQVLEASITDWHGAYEIIEDRYEKY